jgi:dTDP-glucose 4,6-dehydratase
VSDHCRGIDLILARGRVGEVYNIGGGTECENIHLVRTLCRIAEERFGREPGLRGTYPDCPASQGQPIAGLITHVTDRAGHDRRYAIDYKKIKSELGYQAQVGLEAGLRATFDWYLDNTVWWRAVMDGSYRSWIATNYTR